MIEFKSRFARGVIGQKSDSSPSNIVSRKCLESVPCGALVVFDSEDGTSCRLPNAKEDLDKPLGFVLRQSMGQTYPSQTDLPVMRQGRIFVKVADANKAGDPVFFKLDDKSLTSKKEGAVRLKGALFTESCTEGLTEIEINFLGGY